LAQREAFALAAQPGAGRQDRNGLVGGILRRRRNGRANPQRSNARAAAARFENLVLISARYGPRERL